MPRPPRLHERNQPHASSPHLTRSGETITPLGQAALVMQHPVRRWALEFMRQHGQVTTRDIAREFPHFDRPTYIPKVLRPLLQFGICTVDPKRPGPGPYVYRLADLTPLQALHAELTALLTPEVTPE